MIKLDSAMPSSLAGYRRLSGLTASVFAVASATLGASGPIGAQADELEPVVIRLVADHPPPPHPAALSQAHFQKRLPEASRAASCASIMPARCTRFPRRSRP